MPLLGPGSPSLQCQHCESSKVLAELAFCVMLSQYPRSAFEGLCRGHQRGSAAVCDPNPPRPFARSRFGLPGRLLTQRALRDILIPLGKN